MNYLAAYIDRNTISWVIAETESALVIEHGSIPLELSNQNENEESAIIPAAQYPTFEYSSAIAFLSQSICSNLEIDLPFTDFKKVEKVIPLQLQDKLPFDLENIHFVIRQEPSKVEELYRYFVSYIDKPLFEKILLKLRGLQINFEIITPESFYLESLTRALIQASDNETEAYSPEATTVSIGYITEDLFISDNHIDHPREAIISVMQNGATLHVRKLQLPWQDNFLLPYLESHIKISLVSSGLETNKINDTLNTAIFCSESVQEKTIETFKSLKHSTLETLDPDYTLGTTKIANPKLLFSLYSAQSLLYLKQQDLLASKIVPNLRQGQYKFRAPLTEIKEALMDHIVPYSLVTFFALLTALLSFLIPIKESSLLSNKAHELTTQALGKSVTRGTEKTELLNAISELEFQLGNLSTISSFSPIDWLYTISAAIPKDLGLDIESISVSTEGLSFRGTVKDYPATGRLDSILNKLQSESNGKFCNVSLQQEEGLSSQGRKPVVGEIKLCD